MIDNVKNLKKHLRTQISVSKHLDSDWVYITRKEAEKCLELAEAEEVILDMLKQKDGAEE
jgi:hypothetical protein